MPMQGAQQPPMPQPQQAPMGAPQGGGGKPQGQDQGSLDPAQIVQRIAMGIKQRNPGIDPATLFDATSQMIDLMKGVQPDIKAQLQAQAQMFKQAYDTANLQQKGQIADENIQSREKIAGERDATSSANTQARLQGEMQRAQYIQTSIDAREKSGETTKATAAAQRTIMTGLTTQLRTLTTQYNGIMSGQPAGTDPSTVPAAQAIQKKIDSVTQKIDAAEKRFAGGPAPKAAAQATAQTGDKPGSLAAAQGGLPDGLPDPSKYPEGSQVKDKSTGKVVAIKKDGTWITP